MRIITRVVEAPLFEIADLKIVCTVNGIRITGSYENRRDENGHIHSRNLDMAMPHPDNVIKRSFCATLVKAGLQTVINFCWLQAKEGEILLPVGNLKNF